MEDKFKQALEILKSIECDCTDENPQWDCRKCGAIAAIECPPKIGFVNGIKVIFAKDQDETK